MGNLSKAPLVELVTEIRWQDPELLEANPGTIELSRTWSNRLDELHLAFGARVRAAGFTKTRRAYPNEMPIIGRRIVHRYRNPKDSTLYQIGPGMFAANASPPYTSWTHFRPTVEQGVELFLEALKEVYEPPYLGHSVCVRYIDAFSEEHTGGRNLMKFFREDLKFGLQLPFCFDNLVSKEEDAKPRLDIRTEIDDKRTFNFVVGSGSINGADSTVMESYVTTEIQDELEQKALMNELDNGQDLASKFFMDLIKDVEERFR